METERPTRKFEVEITTGRVFTIQAHDFIVNGDYLVLYRSWMMENDKTYRRTVEVFKSAPGAWLYCKTLE